jgi:hypothetical protein
MIDEAEIITIKTVTICEEDGYRINRTWFSCDKYPTPERIQLEFNTYCEHSYSPCGHWYKNADYTSLRYVRGTTYHIDITFKQNI